MKKNLLLRFFKENLLFMVVSAVVLFLPTLTLAAPILLPNINKSTDTVILHAVPPPPPVGKPQAILLPLPAPAPPAWIKGHIAVLQILDKASLRLFTLQIPVDDNATIGTLTLNVQACYISGPTKPSDAAVFLVAEDSKVLSKSSLIFRGWILRAAPGVSPFADPYYDLRLVRCKTA